MTDGLRVGVREGNAVGERVPALGTPEAMGARVGVADGATDGTKVGTRVGLSDGDIVGSGELCCPPPCIDVSSTTSARSCRVFLAAMV